MIKSLISPYGQNILVNLVAPSSEKKLLIQQAGDLVSYHLNQRQLCDLELLLNGGFSPLTGFMDPENYQSVLEDMRLNSGTLWPIPITLDIPKEVADRLKDQDSMVLSDIEGNYLAILKISHLWQPDKQKEAQLLYDTQSNDHPGVNILFAERNEYYVAGELQGLAIPNHYDYTEYRLTPQQCRDEFVRREWSRIVAFQTRNPIHRAHFELTKLAVEKANANLLLHPVAGETKPGDIDHYTRMRCYQAIKPRYSDPEKVMIGILPLAMRMAGPKEALWHAIIRQNYGCSHFIVGRAHADPGCSEGHCYPPYAAHELLEKHQDELNIEPLLFDEVHYHEDKKRFIYAKKPEHAVHSISMKKIRRMLAENKPIPDWFSFPEVLDEIKRVSLPTTEQGFCLFFTGLSGAGKSTLAHALEAKILEQGRRTVTILDGDVLRAQNPQLGFSKGDRVTHITHIAEMAAEICYHHGVALCSVIAPYHELREAAKSIISEKGVFIEVYLSASLSACEGRDVKGLYHKARHGKIKHFTGITDPYEKPSHPSLVLDTGQLSIKQCVDMLWNALQELKLVEKEIKPLDN